VAPANRKLIRPQLPHVAQEAGPARPRRPVPPLETGLEDAHLQKQQNLRTRLALTLEGGEVVRGSIEWHDRDCLMIRRDDGTGLLVMKHAIVQWSRDEQVEPERGRRASPRGPTRQP
jgi:sRNA-binding regulator protein Hfq